MSKQTHKDNSNLGNNLSQIDLGKEIMPSSAKVGCEECNYTGMIRYVKDGYEMGKKCKCYEKYQIAIRQKGSNIPEKYKFATLDIESSYLLYKFNAVGYDYSGGNMDFSFTMDDKSYNVNKIGHRFVERATGFLSQKPREESLSLILCGKVGSGKTKTSCAIANEFLKKGFKVYYIKASQYVSHIIQDGFKDSSKKAIRDFLNCNNSDDSENCHLLILDELGEESLRADDNSFASQEIRNLLKSRTEKLYPTIITTNFMPNELAKYYKEDTISMFCEDFMFFGLVGDRDYRMKLSSRLDEKLGLDEF